jgi:hypothetical protein
MSIDQESTGIPEFDAGRPTTKVNIFMILAVVIFLGAMLAMVIHFAATTNNPSVNRPNPATQDETIVPDKANYVSSDNQPTRKDSPNQPVEHNQPNRR